MGPHHDVAANAGKRQHAATIDENAELGRQCLQRLFGGEHGLDLARERMGVEPAVGSSGPSGLAMTLRMASTAGSALASPAARMVSANSSAERGLSPLTWRLPREVRSIWPLPWRLAACAMTRAAAAVTTPALGFTRASQPSPDCIGASKVGHQPLTAGAAVMPRPR